MALKLKGIPYEYVEEDLRNKSQLLLQYNPVHKKNGPPPLPQDPYKRAKVRFWASFVQQELFENMLLVVKSDGEAQEKAIKVVFEKLKLFEEGMKDFFQGGTRHIDGENMGFLDIVLCSLFGAHKAQEVVLGVKFIDPEKCPLLAVVKELRPPHEKLVEILQFVRQSALQSSAA
ncbi:hypothetical protein AAG906_000656 [Vitis piasezkii]